MYTFSEIKFSDYNVHFCSNVFNNCFFFAEFFFVKKVSKVDLDLPSDSFSPESGGSVNPKTAIEAMRTHGTIKLKK